jgi:ABC-type uncharacterized transport system substrate-binding protein
MRRPLTKTALSSILFARVLLALAATVEAQQPKKVPRVGYLGLIENPDFDAAFRKGLHEQGYVLGQTIHLEYRYAGGRVEHLPELAAELINLKVDVIVASSTLAIEAAKQATKTIPIVFPLTPDPVASGFVASLARPGGNITGLSIIALDLAGKRVELLKEVIPRISRMAVFWNPTNSGGTLALKETEAAAKGLGIWLQTLEVRGPDDFESAFQAATKEQAGALIVLPDNVFGSQRGRLSDLGIKHRLAQIFPTSEYVEAGGLMSYGPKASDLYQRAATHVDKILKGAKPADLPVQQPTKFELIINLKTAKQIGLTIPPNALARADKVIK